MINIFYNIKLELRAIEREDKVPVDLAELEEVD